MSDGDDRFVSVMVAAASVIWFVAGLVTGSRCERTLQQESASIEVEAASIERGEWPTGLDLWREDVHAGDWVVTPGVIESIYCPRPLAENEAHMIFVGWRDPSEDGARAAIARWREMCGYPMKPEGEP